MVFDKDGDGCIPKAHYVRPEGLGVPRALAPVLDEHLLSIGRRTAIERMAYLLLLLHRRIAQLDLLMDDGFELPLNQQHVADTLGLSIVHTNKTLRKLHDFGVISWRKRTLRILDQTKLARVARFEDSHTGPRPLI